MIEWHENIRDNHGLYAANRSLALLRAIYNWALDKEVIDSANPCTRVKQFEEESRDRYLSKDEVRRLSAALAEEPNAFWRSFFPLVLLTGCRRGELLGARWEHVDIDTGTLSLPDPKSGRPTVFPLTAPAVAILTSLPSYRNGTEWVFPSSHSKKLGHLSEPKKAWAKIVARANLTGTRIHDLRRTVASWLASEGYSLKIVGSVLGHASQQSTEVYARLQLAPQRKALEHQAAMFQAAVEFALKK